jgi:hypothetical protein
MWSALARGKQFIIASQLLGVLTGVPEFVGTFGRRNKDGSTVSHSQLAHNERHPDTGAGW